MDEWDDILAEKERLWDDAAARVRSQQTVCGRPHEVPPVDDFMPPVIARVREYEEDDPDNPGFTIKKTVRTTKHPSLPSTVNRRVVAETSGQASEEKKPVIEVGEPPKMRTLYNIPGCVARFDLFRASEDTTSYDPYSSIPGKYYNCGMLMDQAGSSAVTSLPFQTRPYRLPLMRSKYYPYRPDRRYSMARFFGGDQSGSYLSMGGIIPGSGSYTISLWLWVQSMPSYPYIDRETGRVLSFKPWYCWNYSNGAATRMENGYLCPVFGVAMPRYLGAINPLTMGEPNGEFDAPVLTCTPPMPGENECHHGRGWPRDDSDPPIYYQKRGFVVPYKFNGLFLDGNYNLIFGKQQSIENSSGGSILHGPYPQNTMVHLVCRLDVGNGKLTLRVRKLGSPTGMAKSYSEEIYNENFSEEAFSIEHNSIQGGFGISYPSGDETWSIQGEFETDIANGTIRWPDMPGRDEVYDDWTQHFRLAPPMGISYVRVYHRALSDKAMKLLQDEVCHSPKYPIIEDHELQDLDPNANVSVVKVR